MVEKRIQKKDAMILSRKLEGYCSELLWEISFHDHPPIYRREVDIGGTNLPGSSLKIKLDSFNGQIGYFIKMLNIASY